MSHFSVLVIGDDIEGQLAPYHEYECTGQDDEYVVDVDETASMREEYETSTVRRYRAPDGSLHEPYDSQFYRDPQPGEPGYDGVSHGFGFGNGIVHDSRDWGDGRGYRTKIRFLPEGYEEVEVGIAETMTFREYVLEYHERKPLYVGQARSEEHKYGYAQLDANGDIVRVVRRTNPNAHWDWYVVGGRWSGHFLLRRDTDDAPVLGRAGVFGRGHTIDAHTTDQARKREIDWEAMAARERQEANAGYDKFLTEDGGRVNSAWIYGIEYKPEIDALWQACTTNEEREAWRNARTADDLESREEYVERQTRRAGVTYAVVKDGHWYSRGKVGWWGISTGECDEDEWDARFWALIEELPSDTLLTIADCHI